VQYKTYHVAYSRKGNVFCMLHMLTIGVLAFVTSCVKLSLKSDHRRHLLSLTQEMWRTNSLKSSLWDNTNWRLFLTVWPTKRGTLPINVPLNYTPSLLIN